MHTIARASSFNSLPAGPGAFSYPSYHHQLSISGPVSQSRSEPPTPSEPSLSTSSGASPYFGAAPAVVSPQQTPARGCLKPPSKEFATKCDVDEPEIQIAPSSLARNAAGSARRRPNMKLERLPSNAIARIQLAEGVEPYAAAEQGKNATTSGAKAKCKQRVPTPYVKSDKAAWLSDGEE